MPLNNFFESVKRSRSRLRFLTKRWTLEQCRKSQRFQKATGYWLLAFGFWLLAPDSYHEASGHANRQQLTSGTMQGKPTLSKGFWLPDSYREAFGFWLLASGHANS
jgi:hypothetical protein